MERLPITAPKSGALTKLAEDLYWARFALPFRLNHINLYILDTPDGWVIIDSGINTDETAQQWQALLSGPLSHQAVAKIIITHHHVDHIGYAGTLAELTGAPVFTSKGEAEKARWMIDQPDDEFADLVETTYRRYGLSDEICNAAKANKGRFRRHVAPLPAFTILSEGEEIITRSGTWQVRIDAGHSQAHIGLTDHKRGLYIAVDFLLPRISPNIPVDLRALHKDMLGAYLGYLEGLCEMDESWAVFPGHDWPFTRPASRAKALIAHHHERLQLLLTAAENGPITVFDAMAVLFGKHFEAHEMYFASGEARSHLTHLCAIGKMHMIKRQSAQSADYFALSHP